MTSTLFVFGFLIFTIWNYADGTVTANRGTADLLIPITLLLLAIVAAIKEQRS